MLGVTGFGLLLTPAFYTITQRIGAARKARATGMRAASVQT
jgi:hypothetical protein